MEKRILKYIIVLIILIIIIISVILIVNAIQQDNEKKTLEKEIEIKPSQEINVLNNFNDYLTFNNIINKYFDAIYNKNTSEIMDLIDDAYIANNNIFKNNVLNYIDGVEENQKFNSEKIYELESSLSVKNYFVFGNVTNSKTQSKGKKIKENYIIRIDYQNNTFSVTPYGRIFSEYINYYDEYVELKDRIDYNVMSNSIGNNDNNSIIRSELNDEEIAQWYLETYINDLLYYRNDAYEKLDEDYKNKKFNTYEKFNEYIERNKDIYAINLLKKYNINYTEDYTEYLCLDNYGKYYVFRETRPMEYTVMLDTYTIINSDTREKYDELNNQEKAIFNINTFFTMIDNKDYESAYNKLDAGFKENYFNTIDSFIKYAEENFYRNNKVNYTNVTEEDGIFIINSTYYDANTYVVTRNITLESKEKTFLIQLEDENDFVMSFNVD